MIVDTPMILNAHAKINLFLDITGRLPNGYHTLTGVMQSVSLADRVTVEVSCAAIDEVHLSCSDPALPTDRGNLAFRAAELFLSETNGFAHSPLSVRIHIEKHIPYPAGLAGGSTDAAAVLRGLNHLIGKPLSPDALEALGARLGADVPFCIRGGTCITEGIGDILTPCPALPACDILIACAGEGVSTPEAYRALDTTFDGFAENSYHPHLDELDKLVDSLADGSLHGVGEHSFNLFESVILPQHSTAGRLWDKLRASGAVCARMSGSGPSVFGAYPLGTAEPICAALRGSGIPSWVCHPTAHN